MNEPVFRGRPAVDPDTRAALEAEVDAWEGHEVASFVARAPERQAEFRTLGGFPLKRTYTALDVADTPLEDIGLPGRYPVHARARTRRCTAAALWTMRQIAGFGTAEDTNKRFKYLIAQRPDRAVDRLRHADADGLRQRPPDERGRGRPRGRRDRHARRHGAPVRRHRPREHLGVDDDQPERVDPARDVRRARAQARATTSTSCRGRSRPTS